MKPALLVLLGGVNLLLPPPPLPLWPPTHVAAAAAAAPAVWPPTHFAAMSSSQGKGHLVTSYAAGWPSTLSRRSATYFRYCRGAGAGRKVRSGRGGWVGGWVLPLTQPSTRQCTTRQAPASTQPHLLHLANLKPSCLQRQLPANEVPAAVPAGVQAGWSEFHGRQARPLPKHARPPRPPTPKELHDEEGQPHRSTSTASLTTACACSSLSLERSRLRNRRRVCVGVGCGV